MATSLAALGVNIGMNDINPLAPVPLQIINSAAPPNNVLVNGFPIPIPPGTVTSITAGVGLTAVPNPIVTTGTISLTIPVAVSSGGTGLTAVPANGQIDIGNGVGFTRATLTGTADQVLVANGAGSVTLSLPQSVAPTSNVAFNAVTIATFPAVNEVPGTNTLAADAGSAFQHNWTVTCARHNSVVFITLVDNSASSNTLVLAAETITGLVPVGFRPAVNAFSSAYTNFNGNVQLTGIIVTIAGTVVLRPVNSVLAPSTLAADWGAAANPFQGQTNFFNYIAAP